MDTRTAPWNTSARACLFFREIHGEKRKEEVQQAGGARVDWNEGTSPAGVRGSESSSRALILAAEIAVGAGAGYAHWHIVTPRQQP